MPLTTKDYIERLDGITYAQWVKLQKCIEASFTQDFNEFQNKTHMKSVVALHEYSDKFGGCII